MKPLLGVSEASFLRPLLYGLDEPGSPVDLLVNAPAETGLKLRERIDNLRCVFLSPIDYARHGGDYRVVPGIAVSSASPTGTIQIFINQEVANIRSIAVDVCFTSEIILAKVILSEKFPNLASVEQPMQFVAMAAGLSAMLQRADAALVVNLHPVQRGSGNAFTLDLVEEWVELTDLPYVHGFWVGHDSPEAKEVLPHLLRAKKDGMSHLDEIGRRLAGQQNLPFEQASRYLSSFGFGFGREQEESLSEFMQYAYYHSVLPDVPDLNFFEVETTDESTEESLEP